jgi:small-conductance mechanosensitive channel
MELIDKNRDGSLYIFFVKVYQPGDRIEINGINGDVIDSNSMYTTMMEIGEWVSSDHHYAGRIAKNDKLQKL